MFKKTLIIGCGLIGSSILRAIHSKRLSKSILVFEKSTKNYNLIFSFGIDLIYEFFRLNNNFIPKNISEKIFTHINNNQKIKDLSIKFANQGNL